jgi:predicted dehydrogenase
VGDAEDHVHIVLKGANGRTVDLEISGGAAQDEPLYRAWGTAGSLVSSDDAFHLRYLNPEVELPEREVDEGTPELDGFGTQEELDWVEETVELGPKNAHATSRIWGELYGAIREGKDFPITLEQALSVMKVADAVREGTEFELDV